MKTLIPYGIGAIIGILITVLFFKGCDHTTKLQNDLNNSRDSVKANQAIVNTIIKSKDSLTSVVHYKDSIYPKKIDSLTKQIAFYKGTYEDAKTRIKNLVEALIAAQNQHDTTDLANRLDSLKIELFSTSWSLNNMFNDYNEKDSICAIHVQFLDSSYKALNLKFNNLHEEYDGSQVIIDKLQKDLDTAIKQNKRGKRVWGILGAIIGGALGWLSHSK